jgi:hypothetical protein
MAMENSSLNGVRKQFWKMMCKMASKNGLRKWHCKMASDNGIAKWCQIMAVCIVYLDPVRSVTELVGLSLNNNLKQCKLMQPAERSSRVCTSVPPK